MSNEDEEHKEFHKGDPSRRCDCHGGYTGNLQDVRMGMVMLEDRHHREDITTWRHKARCEYT